MPEGPESGMKGDVYSYMYYIACIGKPPALPLNSAISVV
jgi:hypothetical protein